MIGNSASRIDHAVQELIDWLVQNEHRLWQDVMDYLDRRRQVSARRDDQMIGSVSRQFDYNRRTLLQSVARTAADVVQSYDQQAEAVVLSQDMRSAVAQAAIAGVGGVGLGAAIIALVGTAAADVTGILAGIALLGLGLYIIPARRKSAKRDFDTKMEELRLRLRTTMQDQFHKELNTSLTRVQDAIAPYTRFVRAEQQKAEAMQQQIIQLDEAITSLRAEIERIR